MNVNETLQIINALKNCGATHFKSQDFEIHMGNAAKLEQRLDPPPVVDTAQSQPSPQNEAATQKAQDLINILKLPPDQLVNHIFPDGAE